MTTSEVFLLFAVVLTFLATIFIILAVLKL